MENKKRMIGDYEVEHSIHIGRKEVVFGINEKDKRPFLVCNCAYDNPLSVAWMSKSIGFDDYLEAMQAFTDRVREQIRVMKAEHGQFKFDMAPFAMDDCIPDERDRNIVGKAVVINAELK